jgi:hypothetical protein
MPASHGYDSTAACSSRCCCAPGTGSKFGGWPPAGPLSLRRLTWSDRSGMVWRMRRRRSSRRVEGCEYALSASRCAGRCPACARASRSGARYGMFWRFGGSSRPALRTSRSHPLPVRMQVRRPRPRSRFDRPAWAEEAHLALTLVTDDRIGIGLSLLSITTLGARDARSGDVLRPRFRTGTSRRSGMTRSVQFRHLAYSGAISSTRGQHGGFLG